MNKQYSYIQAVNKVINKEVRFKYRNFVKQNGGGIIINNFNFDTTEEDGDLYLFIGNKKYCLLGIIYSSNPKILLLETFSYYKKCNISKDLETGIGTKNMMKSFIQYVSETQPQIERIELSDTSSFNCREYSILHYILYFFKYGCGYYEYHFGFKLINPIEKQHHLHNLEIIKSLVIDKENILVYLNNFKILDKTDIDEFISHLNEGQLYIDFLKSYKVKDNLCVVFKILCDYLTFSKGINNLNGAIYGATIRDLLIFNNIHSTKPKLTLKKKLLVSQGTKTRKLKSILWWVKGCFLEP